MFEQTGGDPYNYQPQFQSTKMTKTRQQEWEEAVELDRILEGERKAESMKRMQQN